MPHPLIINCLFIYYCNKKAGNVEMVLVMDRYLSIVKCVCNVTKNKFGKYDPLQKKYEGVEKLIFLFWGMISLSYCHSMRHNS